MRPIFITTLVVLALLLNIASIIGLVYITPLCLGKQDFKNYSKSKQRYIKIFLILTWIGVVINTCYILSAITSKIL